MIRLATIHDLEPMVKIAMPSILEIWAHDGTPDERSAREELFNCLMNPSMETWVVDDQSIVKGFFIMMFVPMAFLKTRLVAVEVHWTVGEPYRSEGWADQLMAKFEARSKEVGSSVMMIHDPRKDETLGRWYEMKGFSTHMRVFTKELKEEVCHP